MKTALSFKDAEGDTVRFSPSAHEGDIYVESWLTSGADKIWHIVRLEPAQIEALVDYLLDVLEETVDAPKWDGYIEVEDKS